MCFHCTSRENVFNMTEKADLSEQKIPGLLLLLQMISDQSVRVQLIVKRSWEWVQYCQACFMLKNKYVTNDLMVTLKTL